MRPRAAEMYACFRSVKSQDFYNSDMLYHWIFIKGASCWAQKRGRCVATRIVFLNRARFYAASVEGWMTRKSQRTQVLVNWCITTLKRYCQILCFLQAGY
jgi:hypothetical protein